MTDRHYVAYNASEINNSTDATIPTTWSNGQLLAKTYGGGAVSPGNITAYNRTGSLAWPVMVAWGGTAYGSTPVSQLSCVRAANATAGSVVPGANDTNTSGSSSSTRNANGQPLSSAGFVVIMTAIWMTIH
jgi:hypothetical protein